MNDPSTTFISDNSAEQAPLLYTLQEVSEKLRVSRWQIYKMINSGRLKTVRIDRRRFVVPADLTALIEELRKGGDDVR